MKLAHCHLSGYRATGGMRLITLTGGVGGVGGGAELEERTPKHEEGFYMPSHIYVMDKEKNRRGKRSGVLGERRAIRTKREDGHHYHFRSETSTMNYSTHHTIMALILQF